MTMNKMMIVLLLMCSMMFANSTVNITLSRNYSTADFQSFFTNFYTQWLPYILTIFTFAISFLVSDRYSQVFILSGIGMAFIGFLFVMPIFFVGAVVLLVLGSIMKYVIG